MKELLQQHASYNLWASKRMIEFIDKLPDDFKIKQISSSFPSLSKTLQHMWDADSIWWQRIQKAADIKVYINEDLSYNEVSTNLQQQAQVWKDYVAEVGENDLLKMLSYKNLKGDRFETPIFQILLHLFNHGTYHRGQLVTALHQLGVTGMPQTDFIVWTRL